MDGFNRPGQGGPPAGGPHPCLPLVPQAWGRDPQAPMSEGPRFQGGRQSWGGGLPSPSQRWDGPFGHPQAGGGLLPSRSSGGCKIGALPLTQAPPSPAACRRACQLLSKRQSSVTRRQAFLSFWNNFQTLNSVAYIKKKDLSSKSHCARTKTRHPATLPRSQPQASASCRPALHSPRLLEPSPHTLLSPGPQEP